MSIGILAIPDFCFLTSEPESGPEFIAYRIASGVYWFNIFAIGAVLDWGWAYAFGSLGRG